MSSTTLAFDIIARDKASSTFHKIGDAAKLLGVVGLGGIVASSINTEAAFSKTMNLMQAGTGASAQELEKLRALAVKMGADTQFSASDAANAMLELAKAGLKPAAIQAGALEGTLTLAAAGSLDMAAAAGFAGNALNTFGLKAKDMGSVAAALAGGANASTASVESLGTALSQVGPGAKTAGLSIQETVGVLAAFDNAGIKGSDAGTSLKTMLARLVPTTDKAKSAMENLGLEFVDAHGNFKSISNISEQLHDKMGKLSDAERTKAMSTIFGSDATRAATVLMNDGAKGLEKYIKATNDQGAAQAMADASMKGTAGSLERMKGSLETTSLALGQVLAPVVVVVADGIAAFANELTELAPILTTVGGFVKDHSTAFIALGATIAAVVVITKIHTAVLAAQAAGGLLPLLKATTLVSSVTKAYAAVQWALNAALTANPIGLIVVGLAALAGAIYIAYQKSETFRGIVNGLWDILKPFASFIGKVFVGYLKLLASGWLMMGEYGVKAFRLLLTAAFAVFGGILAAADKGLGWIPGLGDKIGDAKRAFDEFGDATVNKLKGVEDALHRTRDAINGIKSKRVDIDVHINANSISGHYAGMLQNLDGRGAYLQTGTP